MPLIMQYIEMCTTLSINGACNVVYDGEENKIGRITNYMPVEGINLYILLDF